MRGSIGLGLALLLAVAPAASAQGPVATVPLAAGEMLLELTSMGSATGRAGSAEIAIQIAISAADDRELRRQYDRIVTRLRTAARDAGGEIEIGELMSYRDMMMENAADYVTNMADFDVAGEGEAASSGSASAVIRLRDLARIAALMRTLEGIEGIYSDTTYRSSDMSAVRRQARDNAIAAARAEADSYAASLGMRVARIARVTERVEVDFMSLMMGGDPAIANLATSGAAGSDPNVPAHVRVGVDFILAPR
ncbi:SIMPL domain-containing protein [Sphingosinicella sp. YJ22]|uniref:SIMPL domain-containing protein n=1 Tax=Sphingosinicella sp. YJ22 TaxID=1104780 RepID=UPI001407A122|nr:SIMPL domain-containing protein [Sphingosinicella sp. YJ22]